MKHFYTLFLLFVTYFIFGQINSQHDYFVQFNGDQLSKKVTVAEILNHPLVSKYKEGKANLDFNKYAAIFPLDQKISIHGNFTDSIPYYQVTIPIKSKEAVKQFLINEYKIGSNPDSASVQKIQEYGKYAVFSAGSEKASFAWNDNYLVIFELTKKYVSPYYDHIIQDSTAIEESYEEINIEDTKEEEPVIKIRTPANDTQIISDEPADDEYAGNYEINAVYTKEEAEFDLKRKEKQALILKTLFENGFTVPVSNKINTNAAISSWLNYGSVLSTLNSSYKTALAVFGGYDKYLPLQQNMSNFVKGINLDFYFDNDNARIEEVIEYSDVMATTAAKLTNRKINKNIFNYFPAEKPLAYMSYHINTKAALENFPSITADLFNSPKLQKEDIAVVTDLISTIVDEEATAQLFDGDLSVFLYNTKEIEYTSKSYEYDENYEEVVKEKNIKKTVPLFSMLFTSTHPTFGDKLLQLGIRKKMLVQKDNYYIINGTKEYGDLFIMKDKDVVVIANTTDYFNKGNGNFAAESKKSLKKNFIFGKLHIAETVKAFNSDKTTEADLKRFSRIAEQFSDITVECPKKLIDNKLTFGFRLNSFKSDKNIILQTLDLAQELTSK